MPRPPKHTERPEKRLARQLVLWAFLGAGVVLWTALAVVANGSLWMVFLGLGVLQAGVLVAVVHSGVGGDPAARFIKKLDIDHHSESVGLGETFDVRLEILPKRTFTAREVCAFVECTELATSVVAGYATTKRETTYYLEKSVVQEKLFVPGRPERFDVEFEIPRDAMHTFVQARFEVRWRMGLDLDIPNRFDLVVARRFTVAPCLWREVANE